MADKLDELKQKILSRKFPVTNLEDVSPRKARKLMDALRTPQEPEGLSTGVIASAFILAIIVALIIAPYL